MYCLRYMSAVLAFAFVWFPVARSFASLSEFLFPGPSTCAGTHGKVTFTLESWRARMCLLVDRTMYWPGPTSVVPMRRTAPSLAEKIQTCLIFRYVVVYFAASDVAFSKVYSSASKNSISSPRRDVSSATISPLWYAAIPSPVFPSSCDQPI